MQLDAHRVSLSCAVDSSEARHTSLSIKSKAKMPNVLSEVIRPFFEVTCMWVGFL